MNKKILIFSVIFFGIIQLINAKTVCQTYDDFSSGTLDLDKWEIRQDIEGQPLMDEYSVLSENANLQFHTQQNIIGDRRIYLFPKRNFTTGDSVEYDVNLISKEGNHGQMVLLTGDQYIRIGMRGTDAGFDELGIAHMKLEFQENNLHIERTTPSNSTLIDNLALSNLNGNYGLYIGSFSGHNGIVHMDYDNFVICFELPQPTLEDRILILEQKVEELENKNSLIETALNKIIKFIESLPEGFLKNWEN